MSYVKKKNTWTLSGTATEGGLPLSGLTVKIARGLSATRLVVKSSAKTGASGSWKASGKLSAEEDDVLPGERFGRRTRLHGDGLSEPAHAVRARRLRHRDAFAVVGEERRGQGEALDTHIA